MSTGYFTLFKSIKFVLRSPDGGSNDKLPRPSYSVLKDKKIRDMLAEYELQTAGTREQLIARHSQHVLFQLS